MKVMIENEGDMEMGVKYATSLALGDEPNLITCHFPSRYMMQLFVISLLESYEENDVPIEPSLGLELVYPDDEESIDE